MKVFEFPNGNWERKLVNKLTITTYSNWKGFQERERLVERSLGCRDKQRKKEKGKKRKKIWGFKVLSSIG